MSKPDYKSPSFCGALMSDHWAVGGDRINSVVPSYCIGELNRASLAITTISRLVHNSLREPDMSHAEPLGAPAHIGLLCALEIVGEYLEHISDEMRETAIGVEKFENAREANHD
jgi:hypothetical protein